MGWLGDLLGGIGDVGKYAAPFAGLIPGVGIPLAAGLGAGSAALGKLNDEDRSFQSILGSAAGGAAAGGLGALGGQALEGAGTGSRLGNLGSLIKDNPMKAAQLGGAGLSAIQGSRQQAEVNKLIKEEIERQKAEQARRMPYQEMLREQMTNALGSIGERPNLGSLYGNSSNPFSRGIGG